MEKSCRMSFHAHISHRSAITNVTAGNRQASVPHTYSRYSCCINSQATSAPTPHALYCWLARGSPFFREQSLQQQAASRARQRHRAGVRGPCCIRHRIRGRPCCCGCRARLAATPPTRRAPDAAPDVARRCEPAGHATQLVELNLRRWRACAGQRISNAAGRRGMSAAPVHHQCTVNTKARGAALATWCGVASRLLAGGRREASARMAVTVEGRCPVNIIELPSHDERGKCSHAYVN